MGFKSKILFCSFWLKFCLLDQDPLIRIFLPDLDPDPDPGSQNLSDPTDPDPLL